MRSTTRGATAGGSLLTIAITGDPTTLDPAAAADPTNTNELMCALHDTLTRWPVVGNRLQYPNPVPNLIASYTANASKTKYQFALRPGRKFASGAPITVDDVVWSLNRLGQTGIGQFLLATVNVDPQKVATAVDSAPLRDHLVRAGGDPRPAARDLQLRRAREGRVPKGATKKDPWALTWGTSHTAGAGPYVLQLEHERRRTDADAQPQLRRAAPGELRPGEAPGRPLRFRPRRAAPEGWRRHRRGRPVLPARPNSRRTEPAHLPHALAGVRLPDDEQPRGTRSRTTRSGRPSLRRSTPTTSSRASTTGTPSGSRTS